MIISLDPKLIILPLFYYLNAIASVPLTDEKYFIF